MWPLGTTIGAGATYLSWKYPGLVHKYFLDKAALKALALYSPYAPMGGYAIEEVEEYMFDRWLARSARGRLIGMGARLVARGLFAYALYDTVKLAYDIGIIYGGHLESATGGVSGDAESQRAFAETHHIPGRMRN
jgi:hypothetical protein